MDSPDLEADEGFDILAAKVPDKVRANFNVRFGLYTAMSKFIIIHKDRETCKDLDDLKDSDLLEVFRISKDMTDLIDEKCLILSIHRGKFISRVEKFHAHVCCLEDQKESYLKLFEELSSGESMRHFWPSRAKEFVKGMWRIKPTDNDYTLKGMNKIHRENVQQNPTYFYNRHDLPKILPLRNMTEEGLTELTFDGGQLVFHDSEPIIGMTWPQNLGPKNPHNFVKFIRLLNKFAQTIGASGSTANDGCNLCINTSGEGMCFTY